MSGLRLCISHIRYDRQKCWPWGLQLVPGNELLRWEKISPASSSPFPLHFTHPPQPPRPSASYRCPALHPTLLFHFHAPFLVLSFCLYCWEDSWVFPSLITTHMSGSCPFCVWIQEFFSSTLFHPSEYHWECSRGRLLALLSGAWSCCRLWKSAAETASEVLLDLRLQPAQEGWKLQGFIC